ncbi:hypothetical protein NEAUS03_0639 [Nematocida ausubeli]|nr:hypothetical protein NEAUS03_0639 [Nematocida ausubeli]
MFYPSVFVCKDSLLYRMYVHSCLRRVNTALPADLLGACVSAVDGDNLSLRLQSRLMISIVTSLLVHYRQALSSLVRVISKDASTEREVQNRIYSKQEITHSYNMDVLCSVLNYQANKTVVQEEIECVRGSAVLSEGMGSFQVQMLSEIYSGQMAEETVRRIDVPVKRVKIDRRIDVPGEMILGRSVPVVRWYQGMVDAIMKSIPEEDQEYIADISSIEALRRYSSDTYMDDAVHMDRSISVHGRISSINIPTENQKIIDFINLLHEVTEGNITAIQAVPYGRIIRI